MKPDNWTLRAALTGRGQEADIREDKERNTKMQQQQQQKKQKQTKKQGVLKRRNYTGDNLD